MIELGLSRIAQLVKDTPIKWKAIHIAGTNGKGSTAAYLSGLLYQQGFSVGRFTSPHLIDRWDCITLNEKTVRKDVFKFVENEVKTRNFKKNIRATEFELLTATAFELFNQQGVSVGVVECGLGGRLDATNVLDESEVLVSVITKIGLDHQNLLGNTIEEIAKEKAGIMKRGVPVVVDGTNNSEVKETLRQHAREVCNPPYFETSPESNKMFANVHPFLRQYGLSATASHRLLAPHQQSNLLVAISAFEAAEKNRSKVERGPGPTSVPVRKFNPDSGSQTELEEQRKDSSPLPNWYKEIDLPSVIENAHRSHQGRLQTISILSLTGRRNGVLLDGAHNAQSAEALNEHIMEHMRKSDASRPIAERGVTWVIAMSKGKDVLQLLLPLIRYGDNVVTTRFGPVDGMPWVRSEDPEIIRAVADSIVRPVDGQDAGRPAGAVMAIDQPWSALAKASQLAGEQGPLVISGSLYLVSDVLRMLRDPPMSLEQEDQDAWIERQRAELENRKNGIFESQDEKVGEKDPK